MALVERVASLYGEKNVVDKWHLGHLVQRSKIRLCHHNTFQHHNTFVVMTATQVQPT